MNKRTIALTTEQYKEIIQTMREGFCGCRPNERIATALVLEGNLGLRISDILSLRLSDIVRDGDRYRLEITEQKTKKKRVFTGPLVIQQYIENYCLKNGIEKTERIFNLTERACEKKSVKNKKVSNQRVFYDKILKHRRPFIMANRKKKVYKPKPMTEGKRNIIQGLLQEYDIETAEDIQDALKDLLSGTIQEMLEAEMDDHLGYEKYERSEEPNYRNGTKSKRVRSKYGEFEVDVPQDRESTFEPKIVPKRKKDISAIDDKIIAMYAKGMTTRQISDTIEDIYGFEVSEGMISDITDKLLPRIEEWQNRPLAAVYPIVFIDAVHFSVRDDGVIRKLAAYVVLGINEEGKKEVLTIVIGENESSKYWLSVLNSLKNRGVRDILILCSDGLTGIKEAITAAFPMTEQQRCIVHMVRNTLKYVANKDMKAFAKELKTIYTAPDEKAALSQLDTVSEKWEKHYPGVLNRWRENWDAISPIFKFSKETRTAFYTTNAIESLNSSYRRLNKQRSVFPSSQSLLKSLYLSTFEVAKKWTMPIRNWGKVRAELVIMYPERMPE